MKKALFYVLALVSAATIMSSCDKDEADDKVSVKVSADALIDGTLSASDLNGLEVVFTEVRSQNTMSCTLANGVGEITVSKGTYNVSVEKKLKSAAGQDSVVLSVRLNNLSINKDGQIVNCKVSALPAGNSGNNFIFSELFFNGETNDGRMMHPDQHFVIFNPTDKVLYADGLTIAVTQQLSWQAKPMWYDEYYPNRVPIRGMLTIPGNGTQYPVEPGERIVIAMTAIDHSAVYENSVDLTGADFEYYDATSETDVDNTDVPNLIHTSGSEGNSIFFQPRGYMAPLLIKLENGEQSTIEAFYNSHISTAKKIIEATEDTPEDIVEVQLLSVETSEILDGVQTSDVPQGIKTQTIPQSVDRGKVLVNGCHRGELVMRKVIKVGGKDFYQDTNNSDEDMILVSGPKVQHSWSKGWRNK